MSLLQWDDGFVTGIPLADHEHQHLVSLINRVHRGWEQENNPDPAPLFDDLFNILLSHFDAEERLMSQCAYAGRPAHARDHERLLDELRGILAETEEGSSDLEPALACCLQPWLVDHIRLFDVQLYRVLAAGTSAGAAS
jgi:hemerythrin